MRISWRNALLCLSLLAAANPSFADEAEELRKLRDSTISLVNGDSVTQTSRFGVTTISRTFL